MDRRDGCVILLLFLWGLCTTAQAITPADDPWEYCATNHAQVQVCFGSLQEAEDWLRQEPPEPVGRRFLEPSGQVRLYPTPQAPTQVQLEYRVKNRPPRRMAESYVKAVEITSSTYGLYCGCHQGDPALPHCYRLWGPVDVCVQNPGYCHACVTDDAAPVREALLAAFSGPGYCNAQIAAEMPWPALANDVTGLQWFNDQHFPSGGSFTYHNGRSVWIVPPLPPLDGRTPFNKVIAIGYGQWVNGECIHPTHRNLEISRDRRFECDAGLSPPLLRMPYSPQNYYSQTLDYGDICRSPVRGTIIARQIPSEQCSYGNPCNPGSGEKVWDEADATGAVPLARSYSSLGLGRAEEILGPGWMLGYSARLILPGGASPVYVLGVDAKGRMERYDRVGSGDTYRSRNSPGHLLTHIDAQTWQLNEASGATSHFDAQGRLLWRQPDKDPAQRLTLEYASATTITDTVSDGVVKGRLAAVIDARGRRLSFTYSYASHQPNCGAADANPACGSLRLVRADLPDGGRVHYDYDAQGRLDLVTQADNSARVYHYNEAEHVCPAGLPGACSGGTPPAGGFRQVLTGISDIGDVQHPQPIRYATYQYDHRGRVISSEHAGGAERLTLAYASTTQAVLRFARSGGELVRRIDYSIQSGLFRKESGSTETDEASNLIRNSATTFDSQGRTLARTDPEGGITRYEYTANHLHRSTHIEAEGTPWQRRTQTDWDSALNRITETRRIDAHDTVLSIERSAYNAQGQATAHCRIDPDSPQVTYICGSQTHAPAGVRQSRSIYCEAENLTPPDPIGAGENLAKGCPQIGLLRRTDGPRADVSDFTTYEYRLADAPGCETSPHTCAYRKGDLWKTINALGQVTEIMAYDGAGRVLRFKDSNGVITDLRYHLRGWLIERIVRARADGVADSGDAIIRFDYLPTGLIQRITQPDGDYIEYSYDSAHRLVGLADALGNRVVYTLDLAGNRVKEDSFDPANALRHRLGREYDQLNRLVAERDALVDAANPNGRLVAEHGYDGNGNRTHTLDGLSPRGITHYRYDARDNLAGVVDPKGLLTEYIHDGLNNLRELRSPDTGATIYTYDAAGNRISQTDARGALTTYAYDALNRLTAINYPSDPSLNASFAYDQAPADCPGEQRHNSGRLSRMSDASGSTHYCYDLHGNLTRKTVDDGQGPPLTTRYRYSRASRLAGMVYPSGRELDIQRDSAGRISALRQRNGTGAWQPLIGEASHEPFGPLTGLTFGTGRRLEKHYDSNYAISAISSQADGLNLAFEVDVLGQITAITPTDSSGPEQPRHYRYDPLGRLTEARDANSALIEAFSHDATGNRLSKHTGAQTESYSYPSDSHRLIAINGQARSHDAAGNLAARPDASGNPAHFQHGAHNRLAEFKQGHTVQARYTYNAQGERTKKQNGSSAVRYLYTTTGQLIGEYDGNGQPLAEYLYLDHLPVAVFTAAGLGYIETDHLGAPRVIIDAASNQAQWRWPLTGSAFGDHAPNPDPHNTRNPYTFNLRYPGQYFDAESGLHYNYFRDYEPKTGRYIQSDPIGLDGGVSTYSYTGSSPLIYSDPAGLNRLLQIVAVCLRYPALCFPPPPPPIRPDYPPQTDNGCGGPVTVPCPSDAPRPAHENIPIPLPFSTTGAGEFCPEDEEFCREQRRACAEICLEAQVDPDRKNVYGGSINECIKGCLPERCGGEPIWKGYR